MAQTNKSNKNLLNTELSIQISLSGLSFCVLDKNVNTISYLKTIEFDKQLIPLEVLDQLKHYFSTEEVLQQPFTEVKVIHDNNLSTLVPKSLFDENYLADYLKFNSKILRTDFITYDSISINDSINVYVPYININNFIFEKFGDFTFKHVSTVLIEEILKTEKNLETAKAYVNVSKDHFEILIVKNSKLLLYNSFAYQTKEDFIYYILFTLEQLELDPETISLIFLGEIDTDDELYIITYKYIRLVFLGNREDNFKYNTDAQPASNQYNYAIIKSF
ncbi:DUF3822 family protein [Tamlana flava]|uniref:DUF3822 family protein n=1 Tax=Tamlana flava TaxID=3158572 RepID=UPI00351B8215